MGSECSVPPIRQFERESMHDSTEAVWPPVRAGVLDSKLEQAACGFGRATANGAVRGASLGIGHMRSALLEVGECSSDRCEDIGAAGLAMLVLLAVAWRTSRGADEQAFFVGSRRSPWPLVAFGMIGTSLSGVTFVSVPGSVGTGSWHYLQIVLGHVIGYAIVAFVLLPLYYRLNLTSIYGYLETRYGPEARATGAVFFLVSRALGATARLYLVVRILQDVAFAGLGLPFWATTLVILAMIVLYTLEGGVKTIVWTDTLQTAGMLTGLVACTAVLLGRLQVGQAARA